MRVGFVGAGVIAQMHLGLLYELPDIAVTAVCDVDERRAATVAERSNARAFTDWRDLLAADVVDALFVCTPPLVHAEPTIAALERGLPVYLEKPLARSLVDGEAIVSAWHKTGTMCAIGYQWRSLDVLGELRALLRGAQPGLLVSRSYGATEPARGDLDEGAPWFADPHSSGGILFELASHDIDLQIALAGPVEWVQATSGRGLLALAHRPSSALDDTVAALMHFRAGGIGAVHVAWSATQLSTYSLDVHAANVALLLALEPMNELRGNAYGSEVALSSTAGPRRSSVSRFLAAARSGDAATVPCTPADALATLGAVLACERAIATGDRVRV